MRRSAPNRKCEPIRRISLLLFHPSGRAERAARHGGPLSPDDPLAEPNPRPMLTAGGWHMEEYDDARAYFLTRAVRTG
ncbi:hypothetical protein [Streptomyces niveus]|uniref:hypothetical protein n=1 Tax=Streptomyces niveus TaxID=193462 RepID=UPI0036A0740C